jgi:hypothetical protein
MDTGIAGNFIDRRRGVFERAQQEVSRGDPAGIGVSVLAELVYGVEQSVSRDRNIRALRKAMATESLGGDVQAELLIHHEGEEAAEPSGQPTAPEAGVV